MAEQWRPVVGYEGIYEVSDQGRVRRCVGGQGAQAGRILKPNITTKGYAYVDLCQTGFMVHRLVAAAFIGPLPEGCEVNHKDGYKRHNELGNLEYVGHHRNMMHACGLGFMAKKLQAENVRDIRQRYAMGHITQRELAAEYGVCRAMIGMIITRECWTHVK